MSEAKTGLALLREPFPPNQISKLPKGTKAQNECDYGAKRNCTICGGFHHPQVIHLDYVGHAALTDRLLDADPTWTWEPLAMHEGVPVIDNLGGMWIRLTVCGVTRLGYGHAGTKVGGDAIKEVIGDALRNAAMRFGAALDLWHKGELHKDEDHNDKKKEKDDADRIAWLDAQWQAISGAKTVGEMKKAHAAAVAFAIEQNDSDAVDQLNSWAEEKRTQAKPIDRAKADVGDGDNIGMNR